MNQQTLMLALVIALGAVFVTGLIVMPVIDEANAADERNKGQQGDLSSEGKRQGGNTGCKNC